MVVDIIIVGAALITTLLLVTLVLASIPAQNWWRKGLTKEQRTEVLYGGSHHIGLMPEMILLWVKRKDPEEHYKNKGILDNGQ